MNKRIRPVYPTLSAEIGRAGITRREIAGRLGITPGSVSRKKKKKIGFMLSEAAKIKEMLGVDMPIEELFRRIDDDY